MAGNSFKTHDDAHVTGVVIMELGEDGVASPLTRDDQMPLTQLCRVLAKYGELTGALKDAEKAAAAMLEFASIRHSVVDPGHSFSIGDPPTERGGSQ